jgi:putative tryptophan/tyrosine transport system substrate-binding protein
MNLHQRRTFITLLGGAAALPLAVQAQQPAIPVIGFLSSSSAPITTKRISSFGQGLSEIGYTVGRDATVEARIDRMPALATDLVSRRVQLIAASGPPAAVAAKADPTAISKLAAVDRIKTRII